MANVLSHFILQWYLQKIIKIANTTVTWWETHSTTHWYGTRTTLLVSKCTFGYAYRFLTLSVDPISLTSAFSMANWACALLSMKTICDGFPYPASSLFLSVAATGFRNETRPFARGQCSFIQHGDFLVRARCRLQIRGSLFDLRHFNGGLLSATEPMWRPGQPGNSCKSACRKRTNKDGDQTMDIISAGACC